MKDHFVQYTKLDVDVSRYLTLGQIYRVIMESEDAIAIKLPKAGVLGFSKKYFTPVNEFAAEILFDKD